MMRAIGSPFTIDVWLLLIPYILCCTLFIWFFERGLNSDIPYLNRLDGDDGEERSEQLEHALASAPS